MRTARSRSSGGYRRWEGWGVRREAKSQLAGASLVLGFREQEPVEHGKDGYNPCMARIWVDRRGPELDVEVQRQYRRQILWRHYAYVVHG